MRVVGAMRKEVMERREIKVTKLQVFNAMVYLLFYMPVKHGQCKRGT